MAKIGVGVVGLGRIFEDNHLPQISACPDMELVAVADVTESRRARWQNSINVPVYDDMQAILADDEIQLVLILTPSRFHHSHVLAALRAGKHVMVEKPMAMSQSEAEDMITEANSRGLILTVHHNRGLDADFMVLQELLGSEPIGAIVSIERRISFDYTEWLAHYPAADYRPGWRMERAFGGGQLYDWGPHFFDQILRLTGSPPDRIFCALRGVKWSQEVDDYAKILAEWNNGLLAELEVTSFSDQVLHTLYILGTEGTITQRRFWEEFVITRPDGQSEVVKINGEHQWQRIHDSTAAMIMGKDEELAVTPDHALSIVSLVDNALESANGHLTVPVQPIVRTASLHTAQETD